MLVPVKKIFTRGKLIALTSQLMVISEPALSIYLQPGFKGVEMEKSTALFPEAEKIPPQALVEAAKSSTGAVFLWGLNHKYLVIPPFQITRSSVTHGYKGDELVAILRQNRIISLFMLRLGQYGIGVFKGEEILASKVGTGLVHSRHKKGGSSQRRFERHREKQIEYFFTNVCQKARVVMEPFINAIDLLYLSGERNTLGEFLEQCHFFSSFKYRTAEKLLSVREPKQKALVASIQQIYSSTVIQWIEERSSI